MVVLVTGGSRGIGASTCEAYASHGYDVIINYNKSKDKANELKKYLEDKYKVKVYAMQCDVSNEEEVVFLYQYIKDNIGSIDVLVNNAGIALDNSLDDKSSDEFLNVLKTNLVGTFLMSKYVRMVMSKGCIINVSSNSGINGSYIESIDYDASKAGVISLMHNFAREYAPNIRVNSVAPGWVNTDMNQDLSPAFKKEEETRNLLGYFAEAKDIANVIYFISSVDGKYINDAVIRVDGGLK